MPTANLGDVALHYEVEGHGPPLVVLHGGLGLDHQLYRRTLAPLARDFGLVFPDQRGNGRSFPVDIATVTIEQLARDAVTLADHLGIERFTVLGHSYGGFVAQELALRHGDRLAALVLVATTPGQLGTAEDPTVEDQGPPPPPEVAASVSAVPTSDEELAAGMARLLPAYFHRPHGRDLESLVAGTIFRAATMKRGFEVLDSWSSADRLNQIAVPTLILVGRHDVFTSFPQSYRIARRVAGASVVVFEKSGHFPWIEEPDLFFATLLDWAEEHLGE